MKANLISPTTESRRPLRNSRQEVRLQDALRLGELRRLPAQGSRQDRPGAHPHQARNPGAGREAPPPAPSPLRGPRVPLAQRRPGDGPDPLRGSAVELPQALRPVEPAPRPRDLGVRQGQEGREGRRRRGGEGRVRARDQGQGPQGREGEEVVPALGQVGGAVWRREEQGEGLGPRAAVGSGGGGEEEGEGGGGVGLYWLHDEWGAGVDGGCCCINTRVGVGDDGASYISCSETDGGFTRWGNWVSA